ncbi:MAG: NUDIX hydrolase [Candidatus Hydrogenedentes bacterium]|nr:NUDIX hydrolase [Candidatus Hydrogenedentota bacterium]
MSRNGSPIATTRPAPDPYERHAVTEEPRWIHWAKRLQACGQTGLHFSEIEYDRARYEEMLQIAAEMFSAGSGMALEPVLDLLRHDGGYATPKVDVRGVVFRDSRILLVKEIVDGGWTLPGGWADPCEPPAVATVREVWEEAGFETRATKLIACWDRSLHGPVPPYPFHIYKLFFHCEITGGAARTSNETSAVDFFAEDDLPELSVSRTTEQQIHRLFEHYRNPDLPTDFD